MKKRRKVYTHRAAFFARTTNKLFVVFGFQYFTTTVKAVWADVVTQMRFTRGLLNAQLRSNQEVVRTMHTAFRRCLFILLNSHDNS
jgi:hypothetical protein